jgi:hypothetical protein
VSLARPFKGDLKAIGVAESNMKLLDKSSLQVAFQLIKRADIHHHGKVKKETLPKDKKSKTKYEIDAEATVRNEQILEGDLGKGTENLINEYQNLAILLRSPSDVKSLGEQVTQKLAREVSGKFFHFTF